MSLRGRDVLLEVLRTEGVRHIFGNPGTTELPLNDALVTDRRIEYVLGLQEVPVMSMADGYAMASRSLGARPGGRTTSFTATSRRRDSSSTS